jgi:hypothetical protein
MHKRVDIIVLPPHTWTDFMFQCLSLPLISLAVTDLWHLILGRGPRVIIIIILWQTLGLVIRLLLNSSHSVRGRFNIQQTDMMKRDYFSAIAIEVNNADNRSILELCILHKSLRELLRGVPQAPSLRREQSRAKQLLDIRMRCAQS